VPPSAPDAPAHGVPTEPTLAGPVAVCVDRPLLALDRPFTYDLAAELGAGVGSVVRVRFHGRLVRGWILGPTDDVPAKIAPVERLAASVPAFDAELLELFRWVSERYVAPLAAVIGRAVPPRVAGEESRAALEGPTQADHEETRSGGEERHIARRSGAASGRGPATSVLPGYRGAGALLRAIARGEGGVFAVRPAPEDEAGVTAEAVAACLAAGRRALVLVPEADPVPWTVVALREAFGDRVVPFVGGDRRERYRTWLRIARGEADVVVATRPGVFAPVPDLGLIAVARESHPAFREDRAPYFHARDVALARAERAGAVAMLSALCPSADVAAMRLPTVEPSERRWPPVEVVRPGTEGRAPRLVQALRTTRRGFLFSPLPGYGVARVCRTCGRPAACATCAGVLRQEGGRVTCVVCGADGRCAGCGGTAFGLRRGGEERVEEWAARASTVAVRRIDRPALPADGEILVGGPDDVRDLGVGGLDLVAVLDADRAGRRPGVTARERALAVWMEAVGWARPRGRAIVQASDPSDPAVQALVRGKADRFHEHERRRRADAGFPVGTPVFRVVGTERLGDELTALDPLTLLVGGGGPEAPTVCLVAVAAAGVPSFGRVMRELAARGVVERVEAEPHL
jgi:primosomal protein N' (replication factor Y)